MVQRAKLVRATGSQFLEVLVALVAAHIVSEIVQRRNSYRLDERHHRLADPQLLEQSDNAAFASAVAMAADPARAQCPTQMLA